jgi:hypothetical protein
MKETNPEDDNLCGCFRIRIRFTECLLKFWRDLQDDQIWKYEELSPLEFLERSERHSHTVVEDELTRAKWFWSRRPSVLSIASWIVWFVVYWSAILDLGMGLNRASASNRSDHYGADRDCTVRTVATRL